MSFNFLNDISFCYSKLNYYAFHVDDEESNQCFLAGLVIRSLSIRFCSFIALILARVLTLSIELCLLYFCNTPVTLFQHFKLEMH